MQQLSEVLISYFYFYVHFRATIVVVDGGGIFGIWRVGEDIWVRFFWDKGLGVNRSGKCKGPGGGDRRGALCTGFTLVYINSVSLSVSL